MINPLVNTKPPMVPRNYQLEMIDYLTTPRVPVNPITNINTCCRALDTDAPGSGKTPTSVWAADRLVHKDHAIAVICPAFLVDQWFNAIAEIFPNDSIVSLEGPKRSYYFTVSARWYIISVQALRKHSTFEQLKELYIREHVDCTIIDESHYVKNPDAKQSHNVYNITHPSFCPHAFLLTATPIIKEADDLWHQLHIVNPFRFEAMHEFLNKYCYFTWTSWGATNVTLRKSAHSELEAQRIVTCKNGDQGTRICGDDRACICHEVYLTNTHMPRPALTQYPVGQCCESTLDLQSGYMLGRTYAQIGLELPPIIPQQDDKAIVTVPLSTFRRKVYDDLKYTWFSAIESGESLSASSAMEVMHLLRRITNSPEKASLLTDYMADDPGPFVVACFYKQSAKELALHIKTKYPDKNPIVLSGEIDADERVRLAKQSTDINDVVIATIPSISEGVDLSHANTVYFYEEDYTPGKMYQFLSRVRRHRNSEGGIVTITEDNYLHIDDDLNEKPIIRRFFHALDTIDKRVHDVQTLRSVNVRDLVKAEITS